MLRKYSAGMEYRKHQQVTNLHAAQRTFSFGFLAATTTKNHHYIPEYVDLPLTDTALRGSAAGTPLGIFKWWYQRRL